MIENKVRFDVDFLEGVLNSSEVNGAWKDCLDGYDDLSSDQKLACLQEVIALRDHVVELLKDVNDAEERQVCLSLFYVAIKAEWMLRNTQYTYQIDANRVNHRVICEAGLLSALLGALEPYCRPHDVKKIERLLSQLPNGEEQAPEESARAEQVPELRARLERTEVALAQRETALTRLQEEWSILEVGFGKRSAREMVETVRVLKDELLQLQRGDQYAQLERLSEFEREFGGLSARQVALHLQRTESKLHAVEAELLTWTEGQQLLLKELGDADPVRLVARMQELQDQVTRLTLELARSQAPKEVLLAPILQDEQPQDLSSMLGDLESVLRELGAGN